MGGCATLLGLLLLFALLGGAAGPSPTTSLPSVLQTRGALPCAKSFPTLEQLGRANEDLLRFEEPTLLNAHKYADGKELDQYGTHLYLRDENSDRWHLEPVLLGKGRSGQTYRAWKLHTSLQAPSDEEASTFPPVVAKIVRIRLAPLVAKTNAMSRLKTEVAALRDLGRLVGEGYTLLGPVDRFGRAHALEDLVPTKRGKAPNPPEAFAVFMQTFIPGVPLNHLHFVGISDRQKIFKLLKKEETKLLNAGWVHGDIHEDNVMVNTIHGTRCFGLRPKVKYEVALVDFGVSERATKNPRPK